MDSNIIIIQRSFRKYLLKKNLKKINNLNLHRKTSFSEFTKIIVKKEIISLFKNFIELLRKLHGDISITPNILIASYMFSLYTEDVIGPLYNLHPVDDNLISWSTKIMEVLQDTNVDFKKIFIFLKNYDIIFQQWKKLDSTRTIEKIIISYHNRRTHIEKLDESKDKEIIIDLTNSANKLLNSIKYIDKEFDVCYLEKNYKLIYNNIVKGYDSIFESVKTNFTKAYLDFLTEEFKNKNNDVIYNCLVEINNKIQMITKNKNNINFLNILLKEDWSHELQEYIVWVCENIVEFFIKNNIKNNFINLINKHLKENYYDGLPKCIIVINEQFEIIYNIKVNSS
uniref:Uncharacterized protein n=1 Tax=Megaviridae environmental sample TaxID=1737588 RepID=A0A5J6VL57_9VIRU|nr:MAG: hypothetical protein [Megaviridae environmental sample]